MFTITVSSKILLNLDDVRVNLVFLTLKPVAFLFYHYIPLWFTCVAKSVVLLPK